MSALEALLINLKYGNPIGAIDAAEKELEALRKATQWQPIETAPKDGREWNGVPE